MPPQSRRYGALVKRVDQLGRNLLPPIHPMGRYAPAELDRTRAYQMLAHAEIEACIEDLSLQAAIDMTSRWKADGVPRATIAALVACPGGENLGFPSHGQEEPEQERRSSLTRWTTPESNFEVPWARTTG